MRGIDVLVATAADFARLRDGRPVASGAWDDVVQARAGAAVGRAPGAVRLVLRLRDGAECETHDDAPGWDDRVEAAADALPGLPAWPRWWPPGAPPGPADRDVTLFTDGPAR